MKQWMKGAAMTALAVGLAVSGTALNAAPKKPAPKKSTAHVSAPGVGPNANPLGLTPAQVQKIQALNMQIMPEVQAAMQGASTDAQKRAKMMAIQKKYEPKMMAILTPAQQKKARAMQAQAAARMKAAQQGAPKATKKRP